jgi:wyosine [tRNA(Phe)-imidazoG37] synthetase (radical SAM superfamily)
MRSVFHGSWQRAFLKQGAIWGAALQFRRKRHIFLHRLTLQKAFNAFRCVVSFILKYPNFCGYPLHLKVDVAPQCQLRCPVCPHGSSEKANFTSPGLMEIGLFRSIVDQVAGRSLAMALYNLGEPLLHPKLEEMISYAANAGINTYLTTSLSLVMDDAKIERLATSGLSMLIVAIDGISHETFGKQRIRGDWATVKHNMIRLAAAARGQNRRTDLHLVCQFLSFDFNAKEIEKARDLVQQIGFHEFHVIEGGTRPWLESYAPVKGRNRKHRAVVPHCAWPYFSMTINSGGQTSPCCMYRMDQHYRKGGSTRSMGDAGVQTIAEIYSGKEYQIARRISDDPNVSAKGHFCEGCAVLHN